MKKKRNNKEHYPNFALLPPHWAPQYPLPQAPPPPVLLLPPVPPILVTSVLAAHSEKRREKEQQRSVSHVRWSHCTLFRDGMHHPSGPR